MVKRRLGTIGVIAATLVALQSTAALPRDEPALAPVATHLQTQQLGTPTMQPVNVPARPVRVAVVPGSGGAEAWAIADSTAIVPGWSAGGLGQTVFLHYTQGAGWQVAGPAMNGDGSPSTKRLSAIAMAPGGEGWAVGEGGIIVHHAPGDGEAWRVVGGSPTGMPLTAISLAPSGTSGFAVGDYDSGNHHLTALALSGGHWSLDGATDLSGATHLDLAAVSTVSDSEAWAVSGDTSQSLYVLHRTGGAWQRVVTGETMFDSPSGGGQNQAANGGGITADGTGAWVVGRMQPSDPTHPLGDAQAGDRSRPFAISLVGSGGSFTAHSYCPGVMTVQSGNTGSPQKNGQAAYSLVCDGDFPLAAFGLTGVVSFGGQAFATGMGLFHFVVPNPNAPGFWEREPDPIGFLSSLSMTSPDEGWMTGTGSNAITGAALGENMAIGHWTRQPAVPAIASWPDPGTTPMEAAGIDPDGSGVALAVGGDGQRLRYVPGFGWGLLTRGQAALHSMAWPSPASAWAAGSDGMLSHWDGHAWNDMPIPRNHATDPMPTMYGVAFSNAGQGWAVGANGVLLDYAGGAWHRDAQSGGLAHQQTLYAVAAASGVAVAGGAAGIVLVNQGGNWHVDNTASAMAQPASGQPATFYAGASFPDGTLALAGTGGLILVRKPDGSWVQVGADQGFTPDGTVIALALTRSGTGAPEIMASVSPHSTTKYINGTLATTEGYVLVGDASSDWSDVQWHDIELNDQSTMWTSTDTAAAHDPVYAIAMVPGALQGWAVGGYPALTLDDTNQSAERQTSSGSVYRIDLTGDPSPPSSLIQLPGLPASGFTFAFLGDSACAAGICGAALGSGPKADVVLQQAQHEIQMVDPSLTVFGGNMRGTGYPGDLSVFKRYAQSWPTPFVAAMGDQDISAALNPSNVAPGAPNQSLSTTNTPYLDLFSDEAAPWGQKPAAGGITPAHVSGESAPNSAEADSHYAFDFQPQGLPVQVRFIVLNDSEGNLSNTDENPPDQQLTWLNNELTDATSKGLQTIVVMNSPSDDPRGGTAITATDAAAFDGLATANNVSAVFASHINGNMKSTLTGGAVPLYVSGGAGSPLQGSRNSLHGYYHSWLLVTVDPDHKTSRGQATVSVASMPVIDSIAMRLDTSTPESGLFAGQAVLVHGLGRLPDAGIGNLNGANPDASQSLADYVEFPPPFYGSSTCTVAEQDTCTEPYAMPPYHRFWSEDETIAAFVKPCGVAYSPYGPCLDSGGHLIPDDQDGYLCAIKPGKVWIDVLMGIHVARQLVTVNAGQGLCNEHPLPPVSPVLPKLPVVTNPLVVQPAVQPIVAPQPRPLIAPAHRTHVFHTYQSNLVPAVLPPPVPVLAASPPLPAAGTAAKKEEEREKALEHSKESSGQHQAVIRAGADAYWDPRPLAVGGAAGLLMLILAATWTASRREPEAAINRRRWE